MERMSKFLPVFKSKVAIEAIKENETIVRSTISKPGITTAQLEYGIVVQKNKKYSLNLLFIFALNEKNTL